VSCLRLYRKFRRDQSAAGVLRIVHPGMRREECTAARTDASLPRTFSRVDGWPAGRIIGRLKINLQQEVRVGWLEFTAWLQGTPLSPTPSIFTIMGLGVVWLVKSRCQRAYRSKSRKQGSYGRSLARLLRVSPSRWRCYCLNNYERNRKRAQGQMSQGAVENSAACERLFSE
jgi:hypothetical protein